MHQRLLLLFITLIAFGTAFGQYPTGGAVINIPDTVEDDVQLLSGGPLSIPPPAYSLKPVTIQPGNQGLVQYSCVGWAVSYGLLSYNKQREFNWGYYSSDQKLNETHVYSPSFLYNFFKGGTDCQGGIDMYDALELIKGVNGIGVPSLQYFPYVLNSCARKPVGQDYLNGGARIIGINKIYHRVDPNRDPKPLLNTDAIRTEIANGKPVLLSISPDKAFQAASDGNWLPHGSEYVWSMLSEPQVHPMKFHAVLCIGYKNGFYEIMNSWGERWGNKGYAWITESMMQKVVWQAYSVENFPEGIALRNGDKAMSIASAGFNLMDSSIGVLRLSENKFLDMSQFRIKCRYLTSKKNYAVLSVTNAAKPEHELYSFIARPKEYKKVRIDSSQLNFNFYSIRTVGFIFKRPELEFNLLIDPVPDK